MPRKNLFISREEMSVYYPFSDNIDFQDLLPTLKRVERKFLRSEIDDVTWGLILAEIDTPTGDEIMELAELVQDAGTQLTALYHMAKANVVYSSSGLLVNKLDGMVPASEFRTNQLKLQLFKDVQEALDQVIEFLEANTEVFTDWAESEKRQGKQSLIIMTAKDFENYYSISESSFIFRKLIPVQRQVINAEIVATLGQPFLEEYLDGQFNDEDNTAYAAVESRMKRAIAYLTMANGIPRLQMEFGPEGIAIFDGQYQTMLSRRLDTDLNRIAFLQNDSLEKGLSELSALKHYLDEVASEDVFPEYFGSPNYTDPDDDVYNVNDDAGRNFHAL